MAKQNDSHFSMDDLMNVGFWDQHKNRLIGIGVISAILIAAVLFFREQAQGTQASAWEAMVDESGALRQSPDPADAEIASTDAEPWALWQSARTAWDEEDFAKAKGLLDDLQGRFADHPAAAKAGAFAEDVRRQLSWKSEHPENTGLPDVPADRVISLDTGLGAVEIGLYLDEAPEACRAFLELIRAGGALETATFLDGQPEQYIVLGVPTPDDDETGEDDADEGEDGVANSDEDEAEEEEDDTEDDDEDGDEDGDEDDDEDDDEAKEPSDLAKGIVSDRNHLSHFEGAISFRRQFSTDADATPQIALYVADSPSEDRRQVVFGKVTAGLELLKEASKREKGESGLLFKEAVEVKSFTEGSALKAIQ